ncbi:MAG: hypothetical protein ACQEVT_14380 [Pseudomonadota bacterium]|uniref:hypothetical protein n=1 Tax=Roseovarius TaxID=74030 RepID=UPI0022A82CD7|nr:hypothetical protein [Roseovarius sp. EGI FJ00037]MCZ0813824.1 hypothetical protein [Roseovarius sp. EGI FJ00037]
MPFRFLKAYVMRPSVIRSGNPDSGFPDALGQSKLMMQSVSAIKWSTLIQNKKIAAQKGKSPEDSCEWLAKG